ncbi:MAG TPA: trehalose-phosphatase [Frankiaceae bacterium]|nr:trehalose-phosphatase [Frankiaceae bacterium]
MLPQSRTPEGAEALEALVVDPGRAVVALDYDGTLAPITTRPEDAVPAPGALAALHACATAFGTVAIVTGRPAAVVVSLAGAATVDRLVVLGHYGEERWTAADGLTRPPEHPGLAAARRALREAFAESSLEEKGISVAVHTRAAADPDAALAEAVPVVERIARETGLAVNHGRYVVELRAPGARTKRDAIRSLTGGATSLLFAGDDLVDLPAYEAVHEFRQGGGYGVGVFVDNPEAAAVRDLADVVVPDTGACVALLAGLAAAARAR